MKKNQSFEQPKSDSQHPTRWRNQECDCCHEPLSSCLFQQSVSCIGNQCCTLHSGVLLWVGIRHRDKFFAVAVTTTWHLLEKEVQHTLCIWDGQTVCQRVSPVIAHLLRRRITQPDAPRGNLSACVFSLLHFSVVLSEQRMFSKRLLLKTVPCVSKRELQFSNNPDLTHNFSSTPTTKATVPVDTDHVFHSMWSRRPPALMSQSMTKAPAQHTHGHHRFCY